MADPVLYEVDRLLGKKFEKKQVFYLVRWKNYPPEYDTWEPAKNLNACKLLFKEFDKKRKVKKSVSVAAKLLRRTKALSKARGDAGEITSRAVRKKSQIIARQKIAAELKSKSKNLSRFGTLSKDKKALVGSAKAKRLLKLGKSAAVAKMLKTSDRGIVKTKQNATLSTVRKGDSSEEIEKMVTVKASSEEGDKYVTVKKASVEESEKRVTVKKASLEESEKKLTVKKASLGESEKKLTVKRASLEESEKKLTVKKASSEESEKKVTVKRASLEESERKVTVKKASLEESEKKVTVKKAGAKWAAETALSEVNNQPEGEMKKAKQDMLDTSKTISAKKSAKSFKRNKESKTDSISKVKSPSTKCEKSPSKKSEKSPSIKFEKSPSIKSEKSPSKSEKSPSKSEKSPTKSEKSPTKSETSPSTKSETSPSTKSEKSPSTKSEKSPSTISESPKEPPVPERGAQIKNTYMSTNSDLLKEANSQVKKMSEKKKVSKAKSLDYEVTIVSDSESDDDDILYSLNDGIDGNISWDDSPVKSASDDASVIKISNDKTSPRKFQSASSKGSGSKKMSLMDFKKPKTPKHKPGAFEHLLRPSSPSPVFIPLKVVQSPMLGMLLPNPSSTSPSLTMDNSLVGDMPTVQATPGPLSPSTVSYCTILDNHLPTHFHPRGGKKQRKENGANGTSTSSGSSGQSCGIGGAFGSSCSGPPIERRTSVRSVECVFRYKQIVVKKCHRYTQIWLNTQTTLKNAFNPQVVQEVVAALNTAKYDDSSLVLFSGIGNFFCSGTDLHFLTTGDRRVAARQMSDALRELTKAFITFPKPVIAAVGGAAVGLGVALLCLCDIVYASDKAAFHLPYAQLSQPPEGCSSFTLPLNLGLATANELLFGGRRITALEAYQLGLVSQVFWPTTLMQEVIPRTQNMAKSSPRVLENMKLLIRSHHRTKMELTNETECNLLLEHWSSNECQNALEVYLANENNFSS